METECLQRVSVSMVQFWYIHKTVNAQYYWNVNLKTISENTVTWDESVDICWNFAINEMSKLSAKSGLVPAKFRTQWGMTQDEERTWEFTFPKNDYSWKANFS